MPASHLVPLGCPTASMAPSSGSCIASVPAAAVADGSDAFAPLSEQVHSTRIVARDRQEVERRGSEAVLTDACITSRASGLSRRVHDSAQRMLHRFSTGCSRSRR